MYRMVNSQNTRKEVLGTWWDSVGGVQYLGPRDLGSNPSTLKTKMGFANKKKQPSLYFVIKQVHNCSNVTHS